MKKELKDLKNTTGLKPRLYSFDEVREILKKRDEELIRKINNIKRFPITPKVMPKRGRPRKYKKGMTIRTTYPDNDNYNWACNDSINIIKNLKQ